MKTVFTEYIQSIEDLRDNCSETDALRVSISWHIKDLKRFERYTQLIKAVQPELHRNALLYCGMINNEEDND